MRNSWDKILTNLLISQLLVTVGLCVLNSELVQPTAVYAQSGCPYCGGQPAPGCNPETGQGTSPGNWHCCGTTWIDLDYQCFCNGTVVYCDAGE
jgi:hypothetical protein